MHVLLHLSVLAAAIQHQNAHVEQDKEHDYKNEDVARHACARYGGRDALFFLEGGAVARFIVEGRAKTNEHVVRDEVSAVGALVDHNTWPVGAAVGLPLNGLSAKHLVIVFLDVRLVRVVGFKGVIEAFHCLVKVTSDLFVA